MPLKDRIDCLIQLGLYLKNIEDPQLQKIIDQAYEENVWFTPDNIKKSLVAIRDEFLQASKLIAWIEKYCIDDNLEKHKIGLVLAGNIPLVGWHDILCCFLCNKISIIKYSDKDKVLIPFLIDKIIKINSDAASYFITADRLKDYDAIIATGSNNSARYFEIYFGKVPHIIRKNRNAIAILSGFENTESLKKMGEDIFNYFGLGCRNVSKIFIPENYNFEKLFEVFLKFEYLTLHNKYKNNYDYNLALFLLNLEPILQHETIILKESTQIPSRIASLHYEYYNDTDSLVTKLQKYETEIQCIVSDLPINGLNTIRFGETQLPKIDTYADGMDTVQFLLSLE